ncbi:MAG: hypothetical protein WBY94_09225 [Polyangiaceae bacterium]
MRTVRNVIWLTALGLAQTGCSPDATQTCNCPNGNVWPQFVLEPPCGVAADAGLELTGVCSGTAATYGDGVGIGANGGGDCHAALTIPDGAVLSADLTFISSWLSCGSDPRGCGLFVQLAATDTSLSAPPIRTLSLGGGCGDASAD